MMSDHDQLVTIPASNWTELRDMYQHTDHHVAYHTVNNYIQWYKKDQNIQNIAILSLNGEWRNDGVYLITDRYQLLVYSYEDASNEKLERALKLLDWSEGIKVSSFLHCHRSAILATVQSKELTTEYDSLTYMYCLSKQKAKEIQLILPEKVTLKSLSVEDADLIDSVWPNKHDGSLFLIKRLIEWNPNIGAYENGILMGWCLRLQSGALGALQVQEHFKRRGIGTLVVTAMAKMLAEMDMDTFALVRNNNVSSKNMFEKLGFSHINDAYWLRTKPLNKN